MNDIYSHYDFEVILDTGNNTIAKRKNGDRVVCKWKSEVFKHKINGEVKAQFVKFRDLVAHLEKHYEKTRPEWY